MAFGKTNICNLALLNLGASPIGSIDDGSVSANALKLVYDIAREDLLREEDWTFAITRANLTQLSAAPDSDHYFNQYSLPTTPPMVRFLDIPDFPDEDWDIEGEVLLCNLSEVVCRYIALITDESKYPADFVRAFAYTLASDVALKLTDSIQLQSLMMQSSAAAILNARANGAISAKSESRAKDPQAATSTWADR